MNNKKTSIRNQIREYRRSIAPEWVAQFSVMAQKMVQSLEEWKKAKSVCSYLAMPHEVQTGDLLQACRKAGKQLFVPALRKETGRYEPSLYEGGPLASGFAGVQEPADPEWIENGTPIRSIDMVIVPGVAFNREGARVGHGGGHYDRLLALTTLKDAFRAGIAFEFQVLEAVPCEAHDIRMNVVVTERSVYRA